MFDFIRKNTIWEVADIYILKNMNYAMSYQLKTAQDIAIIKELHGVHGLRIGEIGGGNSRVLASFAEKNECFNLDKFEGVGCGPTEAVNLLNVKTIPVYVGEFDSLIRDEFFDIVFSISVVEHIPTEVIASFFEDSLRMLRPGGRFFHAIDMYLEENPSSYTQERFDIYRSWVVSKGVDPISPLNDVALRFVPDMATNPDNVLYQWNKMVPELTELRERSQSVSLIIGGRKKSCQF